MLPLSDGSARHSNVEQCRVPQFRRSRWFPDPRQLFPAPAENFPVQRFRKLAPNIRRIFWLSGPADQPRGLKMAKLPVSSLTNREFRGKPLNRQPETDSLETGPSANCTDRHIF